ncbi:DUF1178 family protein [Inquilinus sp. CAU 1745]|uniref:DUF1178 family protein n=1 Tax=Inquilinus sp. CAU 1745 TaxID=3140369 RepID=UPI00325BB06D
METTQAMILFNLRCPDGHRFEAWFKDGAAYDAQAAGGAISCPVCGDTQIAKAPMAPRIVKGGSSSARERKVAALMAQANRQMTEVRRTIEEKFDYVGDRFAEEARRIHYGEADHRDIYGEATDSQARELEDEGVGFARIPWPARTDS